VQVSVSLLLVVLRVRTKTAHPYHPEDSRALVPGQVLLSSLAQRPAVAVLLLVLLLAAHYTVAPH
jgi:hypothetical protein